ncbi:MAG: cytidylate kinase-like family protein [Acidobacteriota bacterium]|nr:cytidylate kinase-like family protein [Acidobacteriota bacterium]
MEHTPVRVITIEREYGSRGGAFAHDLARQLGWKLYDSELVSEAARTAGVPEDLAAQYDDRLDPWYYRYGKVFWHESVYPMTGIPEEKVFDAERMCSLINQEILDAAKIGNCVIVGRGSACALAGQPGCFHIFVYATLKAKRQWFIESFPEKAAEADHLLASFDKRRAAVIRQFYQQDWCARTLYHMMLNSAMGMEAMIAATQCAAGVCCESPSSLEDASAV